MTNKCNNVMLYTKRGRKREGGREGGMGILVHLLVCLENLRSEKQLCLFQILQYTHDLSHVPTDSIHDTYIVFNIIHCTVNAVRKCVLTSQFLYDMIASNLSLLRPPKLVQYNCNTNASNAHTFMSNYRKSRIFRLKNNSCHKISC